MHDDSPGVRRTSAPPRDRFSCAGIAIDVEKDALRAACAGKSGTVLAVDKGDNTAKVRVVTEPGKAATLWFAIAACEPS